MGDEVTLDYGRTTTVTGIDSADGPVRQAVAGDSVTLLLADDIDLVRGDLISGPSRPESVRRFHATVVGLTERAVKAGAPVKVRYGTSLVRGRVAAVDRVLDIDGVSDTEAPETFGLNDIAHISVEVAAELPVEDYAARGAVGNFLLIDQSAGTTLAAGLVGHRLR